MRPVRFVHTRKCAGTSIIHFLRENAIDFFSSDGYLYGENDGEYNLPKDKDYISFSVCRNPYTRVLSGYNHLVTHGINKPHKNMVHSFSPSTTLYDFFEKFNHIGPVYRHIVAPQYDWLYEGGKLTVDFVIRFENLQDDWKTFCNLVGIEYKPLPHLQNLSIQHKKNLNDAEIDFVKTHFSKDFASFGYNIDDIPRRN